MVVPAGPAVVLGRHQDPAVIDSGVAAGLEWQVLRRPTPGGVAYVDPSAVCVEVTIPAGHPRARTDIGLATQWFGELIVAGLRALGIAGLLAVAGAAPVEGLAAEACFGSWVRGEVLVAGRKVFGTAQFRRQGHALFQGLALTAGRHSGVVAALAAPPAEKARAATAIDRRSAVLAGVSPAMVRESLCAVLEQAGLPPRTA